MTDGRTGLSPHPLPFPRFAPVCCAGRSLGAGGPLGRQRPQGLCARPGVRAYGRGRGGRRGRPDGGAHAGARLTASSQPASVLASPGVAADRRAASGPAGTWIRCQSQPASLREASQPASEKPASFARCGAVRVVRSGPAGALERGAATRSGARLIAQRSGAAHSASPCGACPPGGGRRVGAGQGPAAGRTRRQRAG